MSKITLPSIGSIQQNPTSAATTINSNFSTIQTAFDNTLSRDGTAPNPMGASIDMNSNRILNLPAPATADEPLRLQDLNSFAGGTVTNIPVGGTLGQVLGKKSSTNYDVTWLNKPYVTATDFAGVDPTGATDSAPGLRSALAAVPDGGTLYVPWGTYLCNSFVNNAVLDFTNFPNKGVMIVGDGWCHNGSSSTLQGTTFILGPNITSGIDFYHQAPTSFVVGQVGFRDFGISAIGGVYSNAVGRHAFHFDGTANINAYIEELRIEHVFVDNMLTGYSIFSNAQNGSTGLLTNAVISHNHMMNIHCNNLGDQNKFLYNVLGANTTNDSRNVGLYFYQVSGATNTIVRDNFIANATAIIDDGSLKSVYDGNTAELIVTSTTGFMVWMKGSQYAVGAPTISNNRISQLVNGQTYVPIQLDAVTGAVIDKNYLGTPTSYSQIVVSASASFTVIEAGNVSYVVATAQTNVLVGYTGSTNTVINNHTYEVAPIAVAPSNPASGYVAKWVDTTDLIPHWLKSSGAFYVPVAPTTAAAHQFATGISVAGVISYAQPAITDISGLGTGIATALAINTGTAGAPVLLNGALGTPSSGVATNLTGTAAGLTAGSVTTNANLTGVITSVGNVTSIASQTGTGTKFVTDTSPSLITPALGAATATSLAVNGATLGGTAVAILGTLRVHDSGPTNFVNIGFSGTPGGYTTNILSDGTGLKIGTNSAARDVEIQVNSVTIGYFNGGFSVGTSTDPGTGGILANTTIKSQGATSGIGYATGAGGTIAQATGRTTSVTLNKVSGSISLFSQINTAVSAATAQTFTLTNSTIAATDTVRVTQQSGTDKYMIFVTNTAAGSCQITNFTTGGTTNEAPVFNFTVFKGVTS